MKRGSLSNLVYVVALILVVTLLPWASACSTSTPAPAGAKVKVVYIGDISGPYATTMKTNYDAGMDVMAMLNKSGGIDGAEAVFEWMDTGFKTDRVLSNYKQMIANPPQAVIVATASECLAVKDMVAKDRLVMITGTSPSVLYNPVPEWVYGCGGITWADGLGLAMQWAKKDWKESRPLKFAVIGTEGSAFGKEWDIQPLWDYAKKLNVEIVAKEYIPLQVSDTTIQLGRIKAAQPDYVWLNLIDSQSPVVLKDAQKLGMSANRFMAYYPAYTDNMLKLAGAAAAEGFLGVVVHNLPTETSNPTMNALVEYQKTKYSTARGWGNYYSGAHFVLVAFEAARLAAQKVGWDKLDSAAVKQYGMDTMKDYTRNVLAPVNFTSTDHRGSAKARIVQVKNGAMTPISDFIDAPQLIPPPSK